MKNPVKEVHDYVESLEKKIKELEKQLDEKNPLENRIRKIEKDITAILDKLNKISVITVDKWWQNPVQPDPFPWNQPWPWTSPRTGDKIEKLYETTILCNKNKV